MTIDLWQWIILGCIIVILSLLWLIAALITNRDAVKRILKLLGDDRDDG